ncbi:MAG: MFS transporter [Chloroflexi bacterium]|nr:MFS transporter [Chloroflexota bacterium]
MDKHSASAGPAAAPGAAGGIRAQTRSRSALVMSVAGVMLGLFMAAMDQTIVGTALPRMVADLGGLDRLSWVVTSYLLTSAVGVPIWGKLSDLLGRKWLYLGGMAVFLLGSALTGAAQSMDQLIGFRALQGVGGGMLFALSFIMISDLFPPRERGRWQGLIASCFALASVIGPLLGGWLTDTLSWRWAFYINLPVGAVVTLLLVSAMPNPRVERTKPLVLDYRGAALLLACLTPLLLGLSMGGQDASWGSPLIVGLLSAGVVIGLVFLWVERRSQEPLLPLHLFRHRVFNASIAVGFFTGLGLFGAIIYIPLFAQGVTGQSATNSGLILMPMTLSISMAAVLSGQLLTRTGRYKAVAVFGSLLMAFGMFLLWRMDSGVGNNTLVRNMVFIGLGLGCTLPVITIAVQNAFHYSLLGVVTTSVQFFRNVGGTIGVAVMGTVLNVRLADALRTNLDPEVVRRLPERSLERLNDAQVLVQPQTLAEARQTFIESGPDGLAMYGRFVTGIKEALASSLSEVFLLAAVVVALCILAALIMPEIPLRRSMDEWADKKAARAGEQQSGPAARHEQP